MSWRPDTGESIFPLPTHNFINTVEDAADGQFGTFLCFLIEICVQDGNISSVGCFRPESAHMLYVLFWMHQPDILIRDDTIDCADELYPGMGGVKFGL